MDSVDVNDTCKLLYLICQTNLFRVPKWGRDPQFEKLWSRLSMKCLIEKTFSKWGRWTKTFEKPWFAWLFEQWSNPRAAVDN